VVALEDTTEALAEVQVVTLPQLCLYLQVITWLMWVQVGLPRLGITKTLLELAPFFQHSQLLVVALELLAVLVVLEAQVQVQGLVVAAHSLEEREL
jgi:hypothetical protein